MNNSNEQSNTTYLTGWTDLTELFQTHTVHDMTEVMDDALANGFEFKLQGSHIYYRELIELPNLLP